MSIHKFGYKVENLQNDKIENLENELESQTKLLNITPIEMSSKLETYIDEKKILEETQLKYGQTNIIINAKVFLDIIKNIEDIKRKLKF